MIKINYLEGSSWTLRGDSYFIDGWVDWSDPSLSIMQDIKDGNVTVSVPLNDKDLAPEAILSVEDHCEECIMIWKNPRYQLSVKVDTKTARQRMKESVRSST